MIVSKSINDLRCHILQPSGQWLWLPVSESAYYKSLVDGSSKYFDDYYKLLTLFTPEANYQKEISYNQFLELYTTIRISFDCNKSPKIKINNNEVLDGQHRLSILLYLYSNIKLQFDNNELTAVDLGSNKKNN